MTTSIVPDTDDLVTTQSKVAFLRSAFSSRFDHEDILMQPLTEWYSKPLSAAELQFISKELCKWAGIKPRHLDVNYNSRLRAAGNYFEDGSGHHIMINNFYERRPYEAVAIVAHETTHYILERNKHIKIADLSLKEELIDLATIYLGFGALVINGLGRHETWVQRLWATFGPWNHDLYLGSYGPTEYACQLGHYVGQSNNINEGDLYSLLTPWGCRLFKDHVPHQNKPAVYVRQAKHRIKMANIVLVTTFLIAFSLTGIVVFIAKQIPNQASAEQIDKKERADLLYKQYVICSQSVASRKINTASPDILTQQSINADTARCQSLKNQYNSEVEGYNKTLSR